MKNYASLIVFFGAMFVVAQDACEDKCDDLQAHCYANKHGGCATDRVACHNMCLSRQCLRKTGMELFDHQEKCNCHEDCLVSHCQDGVCCLPLGYGAASEIMCCSKKTIDIPINARGVSKQCI